MLKPDYFRRKEYDLERKYRCPKCYGYMASCLTGYLDDDGVQKTMVVRQCKDCGHTKV